jgi:hypothetical protein
MLLFDSGGLLLLLLLTVSSRAALRVFLRVAATTASSCASCVCPPTPTRTSRLHLAWLLARRQAFTMCVLLCLVARATQHSRGGRQGSGESIALYIESATKSDRSTCELACCGQLSVTIGKLKGVAAAEKARLLAAQKTQATQQQQQVGVLSSCAS